MITVLNKKLENIPSGAYYIGRGSPLGNPFSHIKSGHKDIVCHTKTREESIIKYEEYLIKNILSGDPAICDAINELIIDHQLKKEIYLSCFCKPLDCHGDVIKKYVEGQKYCINWFSNMRRMDTPLVYQQINYWTVENFYQAMKTPKTDLFSRRHISLLNPMKAKLFARTLKIVENWEDKKIDIMYYALQHKFSKGTTWRQKLDQYDKEIIEKNNWGDKFWGISIFDGIGDNHLGKLLTRIKNED